MTACAFSAQPGQWVSIGPDHVFGPPVSGFGEYNAVGRITTIAVDPTNPQIIYVGSPGELGQEGCGIWKTADGGQTWHPIGDSLPTLAVAAIALDPTDHNRVYIATADKGVFRSDDGGAHWLNLSEPLHVRTNAADGDHTAFLINPLHTDVLYLTTDDGVLRSSDGGRTWPVSLGLGWANSLAMDPREPNVLYAGINGLGIYKTTDGGVKPCTSASCVNASWIPQAPLPSAIWPNYYRRAPLLAISHPAGAPSETVYVLYTTSPLDDKQNPGWALYRATDGSSWSGPLYSCAGCLFVVLAADPSNANLVFLGGPFLYISEIGVSPFVTVPPTENDRQPASPHGDYWELTFDPTNSQNVLVGTDGGLYISNNHGFTDSWSFIGHGIANVEMYDLAQAATNPNRILSGTQDNGNILYSGSLTWAHIPPDDTAIKGGDGSAVAIDPTNADILYAMGQGQDSLGQSLNGGQTLLLPSFAQGLPFRTPPTTKPNTDCFMYNSTFFLQVHPTISTTLLASCDDLYRTTTNVSPGNWQKFFPSPSGRVVRSAIDAANNLYYAGTNNGHVFALAADGSATQEVLPSHPNGQSISDIEVDPAHPELVYASFAPAFTVNRPCPGTAGQSRIFQYVRKSPLPNANFAYADITGNLRWTRLCVNALAIDPHIPRTLYVGTNRGVYRGRSNATGGPWVWQLYDNGLPHVDIRDLEVHPATGHIDAATYGRSAYKLITETSLPIGIDIKPGSSVNVINIKSKGRITVAVLSNPTFDAPAEVDRTMLNFGHSGSEVSSAPCNPDAEDVNGDGLPDLICHFYTALTDFQPGDTVGRLTGLTMDHIPILASDSVKILSKP